MRHPAGGRTLMTTVLTNCVTSRRT